MILGPQQRKVIIKFGVGIMALLLVLVCYSYVIPRTEVEIDTVYHSSYSALFVQSKISNTGTKQISNRSEEHTSELQSRTNLVCRLLLEKKKKHNRPLPK